MDKKYNNFHEKFYRDSKKKKKKNPQLPQLEIMEMKSSIIQIRISMESITNGTHDGAGEECQCLKRRLGNHFIHTLMKERINHPGPLGHNKRPKYESLVQQRGSRCRLKAQRIYSIKI
jgi:hypothetical protein